MTRDIAAHIKDVAIARIVGRCWTHTSDGCIAAKQDQKQRWRAPSMRWRSGAWRFDDVIPRTHDANTFDSDDDEGGAERVQGSTSSITKHDQYDIDWDDIDGAQRPAVKAERLLQTARQMVDTPRWWLMWWPRNATALLVRAGSLKDDEASKLFRALRMTAVTFGLELAALPKARHDAKEATDARAALRKRWVATVEKLGPGYRRSEAPRCQTGLQLLTYARLGCSCSPALVQGSADSTPLVHRGAKGGNAEPATNDAQLLHGGGRTAACDPAPTLPQATVLARLAAGPSRAVEPRRTEPRSAT